jgi:hypothetical protein
MPQHSTNYQNTFIAVADDCPAGRGETPPQKAGDPSVANLQFDLIRKNPYKFTSDEVVFQVFAQRNEVSKSEWAQAKAAFFSKGQPCLRASPLPKRYGWGVHHNTEGKIAIYGCDSPEYKKMMSDKSLKVVKAMKSAR